MKTRVLSLFLAIILAFSCLLIPASAVPPEVAPDVLHSLPQTKTVPSHFLNAYVYPFGTSLYPAVVKGGSMLLQFKRNNYRLSPRLDDFFFIEIYHCDVDYLYYGEDYPELVEYRLFPMSDFNNSMNAVAFTWSADSRYTAGTYCYIGGVCSSEGEVYEQSVFYSNMAVENAPVGAGGVGGDNFRFDVMSVGEVLSYAIYPLPHNYTGSHSYTFSVDKPKVAKVWIEDGYLFVEAVGVGTAIVSVYLGNKRTTAQFDVRGVTNFTATPGKTTLCVGETDTIKTTATLDEQTAARYPDVHIEYMWRTSNPNVLTVENGVVTAVGPGTAIINFKINNTVDTVLEIPYTVNYHQLPEGTPVTGPTATQPKQAVGHCSVCGKDDASNIYAPAIFTDTVATSWYAEHVDKVYDLKLMNGTGEHTFAPNANVTRAMAATVLYRIAGEPAVEGEIPFSDVPEGKYYTNAVIWAAQKGVVAGFPDGTFRPNDNITREQLAAILYRYASAEGKVREEDASLDAFPDAQTVHAYAKEAMAWAVGEGLINGVGSGGKSWLQPANNATRAQFATIISRYMTTVDPLTPEKPDPETPDPENPDPENPIPEPSDPDMPIPENPTPGQQEDNA